MISQTDKASSVEDRGFFLVLIGSDGAGKSTISDGLINGIANRDVFKGYVYYHSNVGLLPQLKYFKNVFCKIKSNRTLPEKTSELPGMVEPHPLWRSLVYLSYYSLDYMLGFVKIRKQMNQDNLVIFDRYFYDFFYQRQNRKLPSWLLWFCHYFIPKPDLVVCLRAAPETIHNRKPELSIEEIAQQRSRLKKLASRLKNSLVLDTSKNATENIKQVENKIIESLSRGNKVNLK